MGSFNTSCSLSNLQINRDDEVVAFYIEKKNNHKSYYNYPWDNYKIASGGLVGHYADYGRIELLENPTNSFYLKLLETTYVDFEDFQDTLWQYNGNSMMFILKDVYDAAKEMNPLVKDETSFLIQAFDDHRKTEEALENPGEAIQDFWEFCMKRDHNYVLANFFIGSSSSSNATGFARKITKHFANIYLTDKFNSEHSVCELEDFDSYVKLMAENHIITTTFFMANKLIMPQFTTSQDSKLIDEALWQQKIMQISSERVVGFKNNTYYKDKMENFKENQKALLEKHILEFELGAANEKKNKVKM
jgi:hypothetical protein